MTELIVGMEDIIINTGSTETPVWKSLGTPHDNGGTFEQTVTEKEYKDPRDGSTIHSTINEVIHKLNFSVKNASVDNLALAFGAEVSGEKVVFNSINPWEGHLKLVSQKDNNGKYSVLTIYKGKIIPKGKIGFIFSSESEVPFEILVLKPDSGPVWDIEKTTAKPA